jgi:AAA domain
VELCQYLQIDWGPEIAKDAELAAARAAEPDECFDNHPEFASQDDAAKAEQAAEAKSKRPAMLFYADLGQSAEVSDFIEDLLCDGQSSVCYGDSGVGKTYLVSYLAMCVALGWPFSGRDVERGGVIFVAGEGGAGLMQRIAAFRQHHGMEKTADASFAVVPAAVDFRDKAAVRGLVFAIKEAASRLGRVRLIVIDTLSRALAGGDENSSTDMGAYVKAVDYVRQETGAHVMSIHHTGKDDAKGARGHSLLRAAIDTEIKVERGEANGSVIARVTKQRDLECAGVFGFRLRETRLGTNRRGKPIKSCVVEIADLPQPKLPEKISTCLLILNELLPDDVSDGVAGVLINEWREAVMKRLEEEGVSNPVTRRVQFSRAKNELVNRGRITVFGDRVDVPW